MSDKIKNTWDQKFIDDISERVYRHKLIEDNAIMNIGGKDTNAVDRMLAADKDGGVKLRGRAVAFYGRITRAYLASLGFSPAQPNDSFPID